MINSGYVYVLKNIRTESSLKHAHCWILFSEGDRIPPATSSSLQTKSYIFILQRPPSLLCLSSSPVCVIKGLSASLPFWEAKPLPWGHLAIYQNLFSAIFRSKILFFERTLEETRSQFLLPRETSKKMCCSSFWRAPSWLAHLVTTGEHSEAVAWYKLTLFLSLTDCSLKRNIIFLIRKLLVLSDQVRMWGPTQMSIIKTMETI